MLLEHLGKLDFPVEGDRSLQARPSLLASMGTVFSPMRKKYSTAPESPPAPAWFTACSASFSARSKPSTS
ncbi:MAG: hypothetical protein ABSG86_19625 [Thermoguttaceae bacterium]|jgi:hypothetical protein